MKLTLPISLIVNTYVKYMSTTRKLPVVSSGCQPLGAGSWELLGALHSFGLDHGKDTGRHEELEKILGGAGLARRCTHTPGHDDVALDVCWKGRKQFGAANGENFADGENPELYRTADDRLVNGVASRSELCLWFQSVGDPQSVDDAHEGDTACPFLGVGSGLRVEQSTLERVDSTDVSLARATLDHHSQARAGDDVASVSGHFALLDQIVQHRRRQNRDVEWRAAFDLPFQVGGEVVGDGDVVFARSFELRSELVHDGFDADGRQDLDFGGIRNAHLQHQEAEAASRCNNSINRHRVLSPRAKRSFCILHYAFCICVRLPCIPTFKRRPPPIPVQWALGLFMYGVMSPARWILEKLGYAERMLKAAGSRRERDFAKQNPFRGFVPGEQGVFGMRCGKK